MHLETKSMKLGVDDLGCWFNVIMGGEIGTIFNIMEEVNVTAAAFGVSSLTKESAEGSGISR